MADADKKAGRNAVQALSSFKYDEKTGTLVRGQVITLRGHRNDQLLMGMQYFAPVSQGTVILECGECGATFLNEGARERHGRHFHDNWCDCGWTPGEMSADKDRDMAQHIKTCSVWREERERAAQRHLEVAHAAATA